MVAIAVLGIGSAAWQTATLGQHVESMGPAIHRAESLKWQDGPASLPPRAKIAVLDGEPNKPGPFVMRFKFPDGYRVAPHTHPKPERVTVISGVLMIGIGEKVRCGQDRGDARREVRHLAGGNEGLRLVQGGGGDSAARRRAVDGQLPQPGRRPAESNTVGRAPQMWFYFCNKEKCEFTSRARRKCA
jgi:hypothetical protein